MAALPWLPNPADYVVPTNESQLSPPPSDPSGALSVAVGFAGAVADQGIVAPEPANAPPVVYVQLSGNAEGTAV